MSFGFWFEKWFYAKYYGLCVWMWGTEKLIFKALRSKPINKTEIHFRWQLFSYVSRVLHWNCAETQYIGGQPEGHRKPSLRFSAEASEDPSLCLTGAPSITQSFTEGVARATNLVVRPYLMTKMFDCLQTKALFDAIPPLRLWSPTLPSMLCHCIELWNSYWSDIWIRFCLMNETRIQWRTMPLSLRVNRIDN